MYKSFLTLLTILAIGIASYIYLDYKAKNIDNRDIVMPSPDGSEKFKIAYGPMEELTNKEYFQRTIEKFKADKENFIQADLTTMNLKYFEKGEEVLNIPILTKGREGSWWETPAGLYRIKFKEKNHFSTIGKVWMPWSMNFQGNFFIHGETYYPDGKPTASSFTGGCIKISSDNAEKLFSLVQTATPLIIFEESFSSDSFKYTEAKDYILSDTFLSADLKNDKVFLSKDADKVIPIASITKLMTALVATEYIDLDKIATVPKEAIVYTSKPRLKENDKISIYQLLFPLLLESSNESAETIARFYGRTEFIKNMNDKAKAIGMTKTKFVDPSGASAENVSSAEDLFMLAKYILNNRSFIFKITSGKLTASAYGTPIFQDMTNLNYFTSSPYYVGGKNGKTKIAKETNLTVLEIPVNNIKRPIVFINIGSENVEEEAKKFINDSLGKIGSWYRI